MSHLISKIINLQISESIPSLGIYKPEDILSELSHPYFIDQIGLIHFNDLVNNSAV